MWPTQFLIVFRMSAFVTSPDSLTRLRSFINLTFHFLESWNDASSTNCHSITMKGQQFSYSRRIRYSSKQWSIQISGERSRRLALNLNLSLSLSLSLTSTLSHIASDLIRKHWKEVGHSRKYDLSTFLWKDFHYNGRGPGLAELINQKK
jgi:hypothetical protein